MYMLSLIPPHRAPIQLALEPEQLQAQPSDMVKKEPHDTSTGASFTKSMTRPAQSSPAK
jgi:hypothetical protein